MKLNKNECELALEEYDFRSERPLPHEYKMLRQLINKYFELVERYADMCAKFSCKNLELECEKEMVDTKNLNFKKKVKKLEKALDKVIDEYADLYDSFVANGSDDFPYFNKEEYKEYLLNDKNN